MFEDAELPTPLTAEQTEQLWFRTPTADDVKTMLELHGMGRKPKWIATALNFDVSVIKKVLADHRKAVAKAAKMARVD